MSNNSEKQDLYNTVGQKDNTIVYKIQDMMDWDDVNADLIITDPPFGIDFSGKEGNYNRDEGNVVDGYVEWKKEEYASKIKNLLSVIDRNTKSTGQALVFSGWNNSNVIHEQINSHENLYLEGKLYWSYNFAPYCSRRPAHNVYEIFWCRKNEDWFYSNECSYDHCQEGEANLSVIDVNREYLKDQPKYPTRLPLKIVKILLEHYSEEDDVVFDPLAGSGNVGIASAQKGRNAVLGDKNKEGKEVFESTIPNL